MLSDWHAGATNCSINYNSSSIHADRDTRPLKYSTGAAKLITLQVALPLRLKPA